MTSANKPGKKKPFSTREACVWLAVSPDKDTEMSVHSTVNIDIL